MTWLSKMERKYGKYAIPNLTLYLIIFYAFGYVFDLVSNGNITTYLTLDPYQICHGQIWRLVTWLLIPPESLDFFTLIMLYFYYSIGTSVERAWGTFRYNVYLISGMLFTIVGAFVLFVICLATGLEEAVVANDFMTQYAAAYLNTSGAAAQELSLFYHLLSRHFSTYYICLSITLAFAMTYPEVQVYIMFILPIKIKVLGIIYVVILAIDFLQNFMGMIGAFGAGSLMWYYYAAACIAIFFSFLSAMIFFITTRRSFRTPKQIKRQREFKKQTVDIRKISKHKCAICGRTSEEYPDLEFRFCSKCDGNYAYCNDHIFTHTHIKK